MLTITLRFLARREREYIDGMLDFDTKNKCLRVRVGLEKPSEGRYLTQHTHPSKVLLLH